MQKTISFSDLPKCDLYPNAILESGNTHNLKSEPISNCLPVGNQGGIRFSGSVNKPKIVVLFSSLNDNDWPDKIIDDKVIYYGDNKTPSHELHDKAGNQLLRNLFDFLHLEKKNKIPPIFFFTKCGNGFDRKFNGLLVPGHIDLTEYEDLVAFWKTKEKSRFLNYRATFTLLERDKINRDWINDIENANPISKSAPVCWKKWIKT